MGGHLNRLICNNAVFYSAPLIGGLSDSIGRKPVLLVSLLVVGIDYIIMGFTGFDLGVVDWAYRGRYCIGHTIHRNGVHR